MKITSLTLMLLSLTGLSKIAFAEPLSISPISSTTDNRAYGGLAWEIGADQSYIPSIVLGFRSIRQNSDSYIDGADFSVHFLYNNGIVIDSTKLLYVGGEREVQLNVGGGYSFKDSNFLATASIQLPYASVGSDYLLTAKQFKLFGELNSLDELKGFRECPFDHFRIVTEQQIVNSKQVTLQRCVPVSIAPSDIRLKRDIKLLATLDGGIKIYSFKYLWSDITFVGVMAQDLLENSQWKDAVVTMNNGFYAVNYSMLGLQMTTQEQWILFGEDSLKLGTYHI